MKTDDLDQREHFRRLFEKYRENRCSPAEVDELLAYFKTQGFNDLFDAVTRDSANRKYPDDPILRQHLDRRLQKILQSETFENSGISSTPSIAPVRKLYPFRRIAAAAAILIFIGSSVYFLVKPKINPAPVTKTETPKPPADILPGSHKPVLTLAGGQQIVLDSAINKILMTRTNTRIIAASSDQITYQSTSKVKDHSLNNSSEKTSKEIEYNTLDNPRGSNVTNITLSDGTKVWLNAGSSITYPVAFTTNERNVEITGEAYYEVVHDAAHPFTVKKHNSDTKITVLGTHFNVNTYDDESENKITLLEGSVRVQTTNQTQILKPGQQASVNDKGIRLKIDADIDATMAWKNGQFVLKGTDLAALLRQIGRWYDVDVKYNGEIPSKKFGGSISRNVNLSTVLEALKENGINCTLDNKILLVQ